jgi:hypothetical protein
MGKYDVAADGRRGDKFPLGTRTSGAAGEAAPTESDSPLPLRGARPWTLKNRSGGVDLRSIALTSGDDAGPPAHAPGAARRVRSASRGAYRPVVRTQLGQRDAREPQFVVAYSRRPETLNQFYEREHPAAIAAPPRIVGARRGSSQPPRVKTSAASRAANNKNSMPIQFAATISSGRARVLSFQESKMRASAGRRLGPLVPPVGASVTVPPLNHGSQRSWQRRHHASAGKCPRARAARTI